MINGLEYGSNPIRIGVVPALEVVSANQSGKRILAH